MLKKLKPYDSGVNFEYDNTRKFIKPTKKARHIKITVGRRQWLTNKINISVVKYPSSNLYEIYIYSFKYQWGSLVFEYFGESMEEIAVIVQNWLNKTSKRKDKPFIVTV